MHWQRGGLIFCPDATCSWMASHAQIPTADLLDNGTVRIYFATRDGDNRSSTTYLEADAARPERVLYVADRPILSPGRLGTFDDCGAMPSSVVTEGGRKYLYYTGWNRRQPTPYHNAIGLAVSDDGGRTFSRLFDGPIMDRTPHEPYFAITPYVILERGIWRMWYCGCSGWSMVDGVSEPHYRIMYSESADGISWQRPGTVCIPYRNDDEANVRACVVQHGPVYRMWYSFRSIRNHGSGARHAYRMGYAESEDGVSWTRLDERAGLERAERGWDSEMIAYPSVYRWRGRLYMLYNGNGFGGTGFGYAFSDTAAE